MQQDNTLKFLSNFNEKLTNDNARKNFVDVFKTSDQNMEDFAKKARFFVLRHQLQILVENYVQAYETVVKFANKHCYILFEPEQEMNHDDLIYDIVKILNNQINPGVS